MGFIVVMALIVCSPAALWATWANSLDFNIDGFHHGSGASISYASNTLTGLYIEVDKVTGLPTGDEIEIVTGRLNFTALNGAGDATNGWTFSGGDLTITGGFNGNPTDTVLLSGIFQNASLSVKPVYGSYQFDLLFANFTDTKDPALVSHFFGPSPPSNFTGAMNLLFTTLGATDSAFTSNAVLSGDVFNTPVPVPVPAAVWLLGSGLLGLLGIRRRIG